MKQGHLIEIFNSFQGEGVHVGVRQVFVRMAICHMRCVYCDTPESWGAPKQYRYEVSTGVFETAPNPATVDEVAAHVKRLSTPLHHSTSVTGGEPLVQVEFLEELFPRLELPIHLETSGTLSENLARVARWVDFFSLDWKPASTPGVSADREDVRRCIEIASRGKGQAKIVVMRDSPTDAEFEDACRMLKGTGLALVLTPVTEANESCHAPGGDRIKRLLEISSGLGLEALVIPQVHHLVGWL